MNLIIKSSLLLLSLTAQMTQAQPVTMPFEINRATLRMNSDGGCEIEMLLENKHSNTLEVSGTVFMVNEDGLTVGSRYIGFAPAISGGKSIEKTTFFSSALAGGMCPRVSQVFLNTSYCRTTETGRYLEDLYCKRKFGFKFEVK